MTDKTKFFFSMLILLIGVLLGNTETLWWSKLGWVLVGIGLGGMLFIGGRNKDKLFF